MNPTHNDSALTDPSPVVTVLIPTYRRKDLLPETIRSALNQTFEEIEILVLDDCSPDDTGDVVAPFLADSRVRYIRHERNRGIAANWRFGITHCRGQFFCLLHDDDTIEPRFLEALLEPLRDDPSLILAFCDHWVTDLGGRRLTAKSDASSRGYGRDRLPRGKLSDFKRTALVDNAIPAGAALYRRELVLPEFVNESARGSIDMWLLYECLRTGREACFVPERLMNYRDHPAGMSKSMPFEMIEGHIFRYREMLADQDLSSIHADLKAKLREAYEWHGTALLSTHQSRAARESFRQAIRLKWSLKSSFGFVLSLGGRIASHALNLLRRFRSVRQT